MLTNIYNYINMRRKNRRKESFMKFKENRAHIYIQTLGGLTITIGDKSINDHSQQSKKPWTLLEYLIVFRNKDISSNDLIEAIWGDNSGANPVGSLKTLLFRSRKLLEPLGIPTRELIVHQRSSYAWTRDYETEVDIDLFERLCETSFSQSQTLATRKVAGMQAVSLYKGDFLPQSTWESWVIPINTYYHNLYLKLIHKLLEIYVSEQSYEEITALCRYAIATEAFDDELHYHLIHALYKMGNSHAAMEHYQLMTDMFYNEFAITPSDKLKDLYKVIQDTSHHVMTDLAIIQAGFQESGQSTGAFFCEYTVFKDIYLLESRSIARTGDSIYLGLLTATGASGATLPVSRISRIMDALQSCIHDSLRRGDVFSRYSTNQYILLLPSATYENGERVLKRILRNFNTLPSRKSAQVTYSLQAVMPPTKEQT